MKSTVRAGRPQMALFVWALWGLSACVNDFEGPALPDCGLDHVLLHTGECAPKGGAEPEVVCGEGTEAVDGECVPVAPAEPEESLQCGEGTVAVAGECVPAEPEESLQCGEGTVAVAGECVPVAPEEPLQCGEGTVAVAGECVPAEPEEPLQCGEGTVAVAGECVPVAPAEPEVVCGEGTEAVAGECVPVAPAEPEVVCGEGTEAVEGECVPIEPAEPEVVCGEGTEAVEGECVPVEPAEGLQCGAGTEAVEGECVPVEPGGELQCGAGTELVDGACVLSCEGGLVRDEGRCVLSGYVYVPAGHFLMGSPQQEQGRAQDEGPVHQVRFIQPLWVKSTPVTTGEWLALTGRRPAAAAHSCGNDCPVEQVNWYQVLDYANKLSQAEGLSVCYHFEGCPNGPVPQDYLCTDAHWIQPCEGYRLPTEAEWEYAYRAGTQTAYYSGEPDTDYTFVNDIGWSSVNSENKPHPVGLREPNAWGLYDMAGNVREWVWDRYQSNYYAESPLYHPLGAVSGFERVTRGGSWKGPRIDLRAAARSAHFMGVRENDVGFRLVRVASPRHAPQAPGAR